MNACPGLRVSIVTYRPPQGELEECLSLLLQCSRVAEVDVVDNASEPRIRQACALPRWQGRVSYIPHPNTGYGAAHNVSLRRSIARGAPLHLVLNSDVRVAPAELLKCIGYMESHPECGQLTPRITYPDGSFQPVVHPLPSPGQLLLHRFAPSWMWRRGRARYEMQALSRATEPVSVPYHHGCFMLLSTSAVQEAGLFDERFFMYPEDLDLTRRIHRRHTTVYYPAATAVHDHRGASRHWGRMLWIHAVNMLRYFAKWGWLRDGERRRFNRALRSRLQRP